MKIGIIYYSQTGHTKRVGEEAAHRLRNAGHQVDLVPLEVRGSMNLSAESVEIKHIPEIDGYDAIVIGSPVHGGRVSGPVHYFLENVRTFDHQPVVLFVTHFLRKSWGAEQTLSSFRQMVTAREGDVLGDAEVKWLNLQLRKSITQAAEEIVMMFG